MNTTNSTRTETFYTKRDAEQVYSQLLRRSDVYKLNIKKHSYRTLLGDHITYHEVTYAIWNPTTNRKVV